MLEQIPSYRKRLYPLEDIVHLLLFPGLHDSRFTCSKVPTSIHQSASFIIDLNCLDSHKDILADDMGVWKNNRVDTTYVSVLFCEGHVTNVKKLKSSDSFTEAYSVKRVYRVHNTDTTLKKITAYIYGMCHL